MKFDLRMLGRVPPPRLIDEQTVIMLLRNICQFVPCFFGLRGRNKTRYHWDIDKIN